MSQTAAGAVDPVVVSVSQTLADYSITTFSASVQQDVSLLGCIACGKLSLSGPQIMACIN